jgi:hypothetical protein
MTYDIGPTDGNLDALRRREEAEEAYAARKKTCPNCEGLGEIEVGYGFQTGDPTVDDWVLVDCEDCDGTGQVEDWDAEEEE